MKLRIAPDLTLPADAVTQTIAVLAKRRAGKSYTARRFAEQLVKAEQQVVIVDPKGDWWGIRSSADGKSPGLPITILGGEHGDAPLEASAGEVVATLVVEENVRLLLDLSLFRKHEVSTFMTGFLETLYRLKAQERFRTPVMLIIDEADAVAPQKPYKGEERMLGAAEDIVRRGGQRGIGCMLVTQRSAVLNKNVLTQSEIMVVLRTIAPQDMAAMDAWIEKHGTADQRKILMDSLPALPIGDAWFWSPGWPTESGIFARVHVLPIETFDSGATPKAGEKRVMPKRLADVDLDALRVRMAETIERARRDDPKVLRKQIAELERELAKQPGAAAAPELSVERENGIRAGAAAAVHEQYSKELADLLPMLGSVQQIAGELRAAIDTVQGAVELINVGLTSADAVRHAQTQRTVERPAARRVEPHPARKEPARSSELGGAAQRILDALAELEALGVHRAPRVQVAFLAGYTNLSSKGFVNAIGSLRSGGQIDYPDAGHIALTGNGRANANAAAAPRTSAELQDRLISMLGGANGRIIRELVLAYPNAVPRDVLAGRAGYTNLSSKGFVNAIGRLRTLGFIDYPQQGQVKAQDVLFLKRSAAR